MATILQILNADRNLSLFSRGVKIAGLEHTINQTGSFTILGPVNLAINRLLVTSYEELLESANHGKLFSFLSAYIILGKKMITDFRNEQRLPTLNGKHVTALISNGDIFINGAKILSHDRQGSNGVIHLLDKTYTTVIE